MKAALSWLMIFPAIADCRSEGRSTTSGASIAKAIIDELRAARWTVNDPSAAGH
jgi:hypothetical protein